MSPDPLQALLAAGAVPSAAFAPTSRYGEVGIAFHSPDPSPGEEAIPVAYLRRRLVPRPERFGLRYLLSCEEGDRRDLLAATHLGDAALWWQLADANGILDPATMAEPVGRMLRVTGQADIPREAP
jgi:hypothetical protein